MKRKLYENPGAALDGLLNDGMTIAAGGFGLCGIPELPAFRPFRSAASPAGTTGTGHERPVCLRLHRVQSGRTQMPRTIRDSLPPLGWGRSGRAIYFAAAIRAAR